MTGSREGENGRDRSWISILLAVGLTLLLAFLEDRLGSPDATVESRILSAVENLYIYLPITATVVAGQFVRLPVRRAAMIVAFATVAMVGLDLLPPSDARRSEEATVLVQGRWQRADVTESSWITGGALETTVRYLTGQIPEAATRADSYPPGSGPWSVANAIFKVAYLLMPFAGVGFVLGSRRWITANLMFRTRTAERAFLFGSAWLVGPAVIVVTLVFASVAQSQAMFGGSGMYVILLPYLVVAAVAVLGWRAAARTLPSPADAD